MLLLQGHRSQYRKLCLTQGQAGSPRARKSKKGRQVKLKSPVSQGQRHRMGALINLLPSPISESRFEEMLNTLMSNAVSNETKQHVIKRAVLQCPSVPIKLMGLKLPSLLDSGSMVTLVYKGCFTKNILPLLQGSADDLTKAHLLFQLSTANNQVMPVSKYFEADISLLGVPIPCVGFLVVQDPNTILEPQHSTQLPGVITCNLIWLGCEEFRKVYGSEAFKTFHCPNGIHSLVFAQLCSFYHKGKLETQTLAANNHLANTSSLNVNTLGISPDAKIKTLGQVRQMHLVKSGWVMPGKPFASQQILQKFCREGLLKSPTKFRA